MEEPPIRPVIDSSHLSRGEILNAVLAAKRVLVKEGYRLTIVNNRNRKKEKLCSKISESS